MKGVWRLDEGECMKIVVCIKQVPATHEVTIDPETKRLRRETVEAVLNPFDLYAVEQGVQLAERNGGEVIALSMGPKQAETSLREALACGVNKAVLLSDRQFAGSDTWATSYALACAIRTIGDVDLVLCGKQAIDGDTAQVGPGIAAHLDLPQVTYVSDMPEVDETSITAKRMNEDGHDLVQVRLPAVVTVVKDINQPRVPTLKNVLAANEAPIEVMTADQVDAAPDRIGLEGSPTRVVKTSPPPPRGSKTIRIEGTPARCAERIVHELRMKSLV
jgi:electron transfer flavoprotein beta subunit